MIVELAAPTTLLVALDPAAHPPWARLIARARAELADLAARGAHRGGPHHPATSTADARKRFPGRVLERFVRVRDRSCIGPMCRGPVHDAEIDHTRDWARHGLTVAGNLGPPCRYCHRLKHEGGWELSQPSPGTFAWRSPLGATHLVEARRVLDPALDPAPRPDGRPRPLRRVRRPPPPLDTGWVDRRRRVVRSTDVPAPSPAPSPTTADDRHPDEPPF